MKRYTIYLDESGIADLTDSVYPNFLLTGFVVDHDEDSELSGYFNFLKRRYKLDKEKSFHAYDLFENKRSEVYLSDSKATRISKSLTELIKLAPIKIGVLCVSKDELKKFLNIQNDEDFKGSEQKKRDKEIAYEVLAAHLFWWFADFTKKERARGAVVAESRKNADYTLLRTYLRCKKQDTFQSAVLKKSCDNMRDTISSIRFENKIGVWPGLELADIISYISFLKSNNRLQKFKKRGLVPVWHEIKKKIEKNKIQQIRDSGFKKYIKSDRVRKWSNILRLLVNPTRRVDVH